MNLSLPVVSAPRRFCAPSFVRPVVCALLLAGLTLLTPDARAGTYDWTGTDPTTGQPIYSPAYSGGTSSADSVTTNTHVTG